MFLHLYHSVFATFAGVDFQNGTEVVPFLCHFFGYFSIASASFFTSCSPYWYRSRYSMVCSSRPATSCTVSTASCTSGVPSGTNVRHCGAVMAGRGLAESAEIAGEFVRHAMVSTRNQPHFEDRGVSFELNLGELTDLVK